jgi:hypothetical protein
VSPVEVELEDFILKVAEEVFFGLVRMLKFIERVRHGSLDGSRSPAAYCLSISMAAPVRVGVQMPPADAFSDVIAGRDLVDAIDH